MELADSESLFSSTGQTGAWFLEWTEMCDLSLINDGSVGEEKNTVSRFSDTDLKWPSFRLWANNLGTDLAAPFLILGLHAHCMH